MGGPSEIFSIGHSNLSYDGFLQLAREHGLTAIADVRSAPYSRHSPQFNRETLYGELRADGFAYVFLGCELGGRPKNTRFFCDGVADYEQMARVPDFTAGLDRVVDGASRYRIALMCSEHDPLDCHRCLLVGRALKERGLSVRHILSGGGTKTQLEIEDSLLAMAGQDGRQANIFASPAECLASAYRDRARKVAYAAPPPKRTHAIAAE